MTLMSVSNDPAALTVTVVAQFDVPVRRLWNAYSDPRQLEKFWGPPTYPAKFTRHDWFPGGRSDYTMTGPGGDESRGYWEYLAIDPERSFEVRDGFSNPDGSANTTMPSMRMVFTFAETDDGSEVSIVTHFPSAGELASLLQMGMDEGMRQAMGQMDAVLADSTSFAAGNPCMAQVLNDTQVRISRVIAGSVDQVWQAHHDPALMKTWLLGPEGWTMPVCEVANNVGDTFRNAWQHVDSDEQFGFTGELLESQPPHRELTSETMLGVDGPGTTNEMTLIPVDGGTLLTLVLTYPDLEMRNNALSPEMLAGMEASYSRLESDVLAPS